MIWDRYCFPATALEGLAVSPHCCEKARDRVVTNSTYADRSLRLRPSYPSSSPSASSSRQLEASCYGQALRSVKRADTIQSADGLIEDIQQVQELSIDYQDCATRAPEWPTFSSVPSSHFSTSFKNATPAAEVPSWSRNTTLVHYGNGGDYTVNTTVCMLQFYVPDVIGPPVLFYYRLTNFYQNHRRYVKSYDQDQLSGKFRSNTSIHESDCDPLRTDDATGKAYYPCGLIANSVFNDTFFSPVLLNTPGSNAGNTTYQMSNKGIAWDSDKDLYKTTAYTVDQVVPPPNWRVRYPTYNETFPLPDLHDDEAFQVWMRTAGLPSFSKLALRNDDTAMAVGRYQVDIHDCESRLSLCGGRAASH